MSADNWAICPKCYKFKKDIHVKKAEESYGKLELNHYKRLIKEAIKKDNEFELIKNSFREDYEIGVDDSGKFEIRYKGLCKECGLYYSYKYKVILDLEKLTINRE